MHHVSATSLPPMQAPNLLGSYPELPPRAAWFQEKFNNRVVSQQ